MSQFSLTRSTLEALGITPIIKKQLHHQHDVIIAFTINIIH